MLGNSYVGIDMGSGYIKISYKNSVYEINTPEESIDKGVITNISKMAESIRLLVSQKKLAGKHTVIVYNGPSIFTKVIKIPLMEDGQIQSYLNLEAESIVPFPNKEGVVDYLTLKKEHNTMEILVIAIQNELIIPYIDVIKHAGLTPLAIDIPAIAMARMIFGEKEDGLQLIVDVGNATTDIHIYQNSIFSFSRSINIGGEDFDNTLSASMGIDKETATKDRLANAYEPMTFRGIFTDIQRELTRSIDYYRYRYGNQELSSFTKVYLLGGNSNMIGLNELIEETTGCTPIIIEDSRNVMVKGLGKWRLSK